MYAPITDITAAVGAPIKAGDVLGKATDGGFLHFSYIPKGDAFATATAVDPNPCFCKWAIRTELHCLLLDWAGRLLQLVACW